MLTRSMPLIFLVNLLVMGCHLVELPKPKPPKPIEITLQSEAPFTVGAAIDPTRLRNDTAYRRVLSKEFDGITAENMLKMNNVHPAQNTYDWSRADYIVQFALDGKKRMHGHTFVWHQAIPGWVNNFVGDSAAWEGLLKDHILKVGGYYQGKVSSWDVVNEAFQSNGSLRNTGEGGSIWRRNLGPDYVARCFQYARQADPKAVLFYNDFGQETSPAKLKAMLDMVTDFKKRNIPIDGIGLQMHINLNTPNEGIANAIRSSAQTGLKVHISELDVAINPGGSTSIEFTDELKERQRQKFFYVVKTYKELVPKAQQHGITTWNVGDADSWLRSYYKRKDWPLPFDDAYQKKPAYYGFIEGLR